MGKGIRKLAGEMLTIGGQKSYALGYDAGASNIYPIAFKNGLVVGSVVGGCVISLIGLGIWGTKKLIKQHNTKKKESLLLLENGGEVLTNG